MILTESYKMYNGVMIPKLGLGTWKASPEQAADIVKNGVELGYRHFDTARAYQNEEGVGEGIKKCSVSRNELFITSKIPAEMKTYESAKESIDLSLSRLDVDYIDLMLIHWPWPWDESREYNNYFKENLEVWRAMEEAVKAGKLRSIGVSNFSEEDIQNIIDNASIKPMASQVLCNVQSTPMNMIEYCKAHEIVAEAYSPNGNGGILSNENIVNLAKKYGVSVAQLCIKYTLELGMVSLPKTTSVEHMKENMLMDFSISKEDVEIISNATRVSSERNPYKQK